VWFDPREDAHSTPVPTPTPAAPEGAITRDSMLRGRVTLLQPRRGFRSSLDPVLLAGFVGAPYGHLLDIGCGTGAIAFLLLARDPAATGVGVEIQPRLAGLLERAVIENGHQARFRVEHADIRRASLPGASFDLVVSNPPYLPLGQGALPPDEERAIAHHEVKLGLGEWIDRAAALCKPDGRVAVVFPATRAAELLGALQAGGLPPARLRPVYPRPGQPATRILVEARRVTAARPLVVEPALLVHEGDGYSEEVRRHLGEIEDEGPA
jgi:tRNA1Val (adenine37-N6)-methyltransferase